MKISFLFNLGLENASAFKINLNPRDLKQKLILWKALFDNECRHFNSPLQAENLYCGFIFHSILSKGNKYFRQTGNFSKDSTEFGCFHLSRLLFTLFGALHEERLLNRLAVLCALPLFEWLMRFLLVFPSKAIKAQERVPLLFHTLIKNFPLAIPLKALLPFGLKLSISLCINTWMEHHVWAANVQIAEKLTSIATEVGKVSGFSSPCPQRKNLF